MKKRMSILMILLIAGLVPAAVTLAFTAYSGSYMWYSGRGNNLEHILTSQQFTLPETAPILSFWTWYDMEPGQDVGSVEVSTDGGATWAGLEGNLTVIVDNWWPVLNGNSGGWVETTYDLEPYRGISVMLRFRYVTNDSKVSTGWAIDDISVTGGFFDDVESGPGDWSATGWVIVAEVLEDLDDMVDALAEEVNALVDNGTLNKGQGHALTTTLDKAKSKLTQGNTKAAINQLEAFINQVGAFIKSGILTEEKGQQLIDMAQEIIDSSGWIQK